MAFFVVAGVALAGLLAVLVLLLPAAYSGFLVALLFGMFGILLLLVALIPLLVAVMRSQAAQRTELAVALMLGGHPGVDVRRLQAGRAVPSPQSVELRLRRERDDAGARWLLVDAYALPVLPGW